DDPARAFHQIALFDLVELAQQHGADAILFQVQGDAEHAVRELEHLARHRVVDAMDTRDAIADRDDAADLGDVDVDSIAADLLADDLGDFFGFDVHHRSLKQPAASGQLPVTLLAAGWPLTTGCQLLTFLS